MEIGNVLFASMFDLNFTEHKFSLWLFGATKVIFILEKIVKLTSFSFVSLYIFLLNQTVGNSVRVIVLGASKNVREMS